MTCFLGQGVIICYAAPAVTIKVKQDFFVYNQNSIVTKGSKHNKLAGP